MHATNSLPYLFVSKGVALRLIMSIALLGGLPLIAQEEASRVWTNQQGRAIKAKLLGVTQQGVSLQLESGVTTAVPLTTLSQPDQLYLQQWIQKAAAPAAAAQVSTANTSPLGPLTWPPIVAINPKATTITVGEQNARERKFSYESGSFRFVANAALTPTVMKELASDFELVRAMLAQLPWGWQPKPKEGTHFLVYLTETNEDFIALGGNDSSGGGSKDDYIFSKFSAMGLKKVGPRYAFDAREKSEGEVVGLTTRLLLGEMRSLTYPWSALGLEELIRKVAYHKGEVKLNKLESALKARIQEQAQLGVTPDTERLITYLRMPAKSQRSDVKLIRQQNYFDGMLLVYYFGFLEGDGTGKALHQYYRAISQEALGWRAYRETDAKSTRPRSNNTGSYPEWALDHLNTLLAGRTDAQLKTDIVAKYRAINVKLEP